MVYTEEPLEIKTVADQISCSIYPNPAQASDVIYLKIQSADHRAVQGAQVFVYDMTGKCLQVSPITGELSTIDLSSHAHQYRPLGTYYPDYHHTAGRLPR